MFDTKTLPQSYRLAGLAAAAAVFLLLLAPAPAAADCGSQGDVEGGSSHDAAGVDVAVTTGCNGTGNPLYDYFEGFIILLAAGVGLVVVGAIIFGGITYASARGDQSQVEKAIDIIRNAIIAFIVFLLMAAFLNFIIPGGVL